MMLLHATCLFLVILPHCCGLRIGPRDPGGPHLAASPGDAGPRLPSPATGPLHKRGMGWGLNATQVHQFAGLSWWYNWGPNVGDPEAVAAAKEVKMRFIPMQWGSWGVDKLPSLIQPGSSVVLGFNEPNHGPQSAIDPVRAAELWRQLMPIADRLGLRLGSPAAAPCGATCLEPSPFVWWDKFFAACQDLGGCRVDFLATHYYGGRVDWTASYLRECRKYGLPIWLTEFANPNPDGPDVVSWEYMKQALQMLDRDDWVEKYAWYAMVTYDWLGTADSLIDVATGELTYLGQLYHTYIPVPAATAEQPVHPANASAAAGSSSGAADSSAYKSWSELCDPCIQHLRGRGRLAALPPPQQRYCGVSCGFWDPIPRRGKGRAEQPGA